VRRVQRGQQDVVRVPRIRDIARLDRRDPARDGLGLALIAAVIKEPQLTPGLAAGKQPVPALHRGARAEQGAGCLLGSRDRHDLAHVAGPHQVHQSAAKPQLVDHSLDHELQGLPQLQARGDAAQQLDTGAASLYVYVRNTAELHALMLDELLAGLDLSPVTAEGNWRDRLVTVLWSYVRVLTEPPELAQSALVTRPSGPGYLNLVDGLLALLDAGVSADRASWAVDLLLHFATSTAAEQGTRQRAIDAGD